MRYTLLISFVLLGALLTNAQTAVSRLADIGWLAGCWERNDKSKSLISEQWMAPVGGLMIGMGRTVKSGKAVDFEFMRIEQRGVDIYYIAKPKDNSKETVFRMISSQPRAVTFEYLKHDFPQRVMYKLTAAGGLMARIEGTVNGKLKGIDFPMIKAKCG